MKDFIELPQQQEVTQKSYRRELVTELTVPMSFAVMEGGFVGVVADKLYQVEPWVLAIITAAPMFSNLSSFVWAKIIRGRDKVSTIVTIQYLMANSNTHTWLMGKNNDTCTMVLRRSTCM